MIDVWLFNCTRIKALQEVTQWHWLGFNSLHIIYLGVLVCVFLVFTLLVVFWSSWICILVAVIILENSWLLSLLIFLLHMLDHLIFLYTSCILCCYLFILVSLCFLSLAIEDILYPFTKLCFQIHNAQICNSMTSVTEKDEDHGIHKSSF